MFGVCPLFTLTFRNSRLQLNVWGFVFFSPGGFYRAELAATWTPRQQLTGRGCHVAAMSAPDVTRTMTQILLLLLAASSFLACFTDSFRSSDGNVYHGLASPRGMWLFDYPTASTKALPDLSNYRVRFMDFVHGLLSVLIFGVVAIKDKNVASCFYPQPGQETKEILRILPLRKEEENFSSLSPALFPLLSPRVSLRRKLLPSREEAGGGKSSSLPLSLSRLPPSRALSCMRAYARLTGRRRKISPRVSSRRKLLPSREEAGGGKSSSLPLSLSLLPPSLSSSLLHAGICALNGKEEENLSSRLLATEIASVARRGGRRKVFLSPARLSLSRALPLSPASLPPAIWATPNPQPAICPCQRRSGN